MVEPKRKDDPPGFPRPRSDVDSMFLELLRGERARRYGASVRPNADVYFDTQRRVLVVKLELAGIDPDKIDLEVDEGALRISGTRVDTKHPEVVYQQMEISYGRFERVVPLPPEVDPASASADYTNGFLEIVLPLKRRARRKRITINLKDESLPAGDGEEPGDEGRRKP